MNIEKLSRGELVKLRAEIDTAIETLETRRKAEARAAAEEAAKQHGFKLSDLLNGEKPGKKTQKNPPKYRNPADASQTWTGRGRQPAWIKEALAEDQSLESFQI